MRTSVPLVRAIVLVYFLAFFCRQAGAQSINFLRGKIEVGVGIGPMFFVGDLGGSGGTGKTFIKDLDLPLTKLSKGFYLNVYPIEFIGLRLAANMGELQGDDAQAPSKGGAEMDRKERNLHFRSKIQEAYAALEIYPTVLLEKYDGLKGKIRPYALAGAGIYHFDPEAKDVDGRWIKLSPLHLEGQGFPEYSFNEPYKLTQKNILLGGGVKYYITDNLYTGFEILHRKLFTDYIDDVSQNYYIDPIYFDRHLPAQDAAVARRMYYRGIYSFPATRPYEEFAQRGDPRQNDAYFTSIIRLGWRINGGASGELKRLKCPVFF